MGQLLDFLASHWILTSALILTLLLLIAHEASIHLLGIREIQPNELTRLMNHEQATVLDVRDESAFKQGHIIHAKHTPFVLLNEQLEKYAMYKESPLILYCANGQQSAKACALLNKAGFKQLYKLSGGVATWSNANLPLKKS